MDKKKGWIKEAKILESPNFDQRSDEISLIAVSYTHLTLPTI